MTASYLNVLKKDFNKLGHLLKFKTKRKFGLVDRKKVSDYLSQNRVRKLHIGCGHKILNNWLNSDYYPHSPAIFHLDATKSFPMNDNEFDYIFSEHMIEHISYKSGLVMLTECFRCLKEEGTIRISTPDLSFLIDLYKNEKSSLQKAYIKWFTDTFIRDLDYYEDTFVINHFVRGWGHQFIYDEKTLRASLERAGFSKIKRYPLNQSEDDALKNLEDEKRMQNKIRYPEGFLRLETITLEAKKIGHLNSFISEE